MNRELNIEQHDELRRYLRETGRLLPDESPRCETLAGGVSNRTVFVELREGRAWVIKQALAKLRVKDDWFADPGRIHREALGLRWLARLAPVGSVPAFAFEDTTFHLLAMEAVPQPHENWKTRLLAHGPEDRHVRQFGSLLGTIHERGNKSRAETASAFADRSFFETLRIEPYYEFTANRQPESAAFLHRLIEETRAIRLTVVHADYSPKNVLIHRDRLVLLDHEVIHFGDPAFDLGFALTHLLSKAHHLPQHRGAFLHATQGFWDAYGEAAVELAGAPGLEARAVRHTLGCLLARVDGRSPLEYLTEPERVRQREIVLAYMREPPARLPELISTFASSLAG